VIVAPNRVLSRQQLLRDARHANVHVSDRTVDIHIARIRKKIGSSMKGSDLIKTVQDEGYMFVAKTEPAE
jgi:two-component system, OmpR family, response regulator